MKWRESFIPVELSIIHDDVRRLLRSSAPRMTIFMLVWCAIAIAVYCGVVAVYRDHGVIISPGADDALLFVFGVFFSVAWVGYGFHVIIRAEHRFRRRGT